MSIEKKKKKVIKMKNNAEKIRRWRAENDKYYSRNWWFVFYPDDLPEDWKKRLQETHEKILISPLHEKDIRADGTPKKPHYHVIFIFQERKSVVQIEKMLLKLFPVLSDKGDICGIAKFFKSECKEKSERYPDFLLNEIRIGSLKGSVRYLVHADDPDKFQYDRSLIQALGGADYIDYFDRTKYETVKIYQEISHIIRENDIRYYFHLLDFLESNGLTEEYELVSRHATLHFTAYIKSYSQLCKDKNYKSKEKLSMEEVIKEQSERIKELMKRLGEENSFD